MASHPYSRDVTVAAILDYYKFLVSMGAIAEGSIRIPPPSGWQDLTSSVLAPLGKNEEVMDLLRHLPYISWGYGGGNSKIAYETDTIAYTAKEITWCLGRKTLEGLLVPVGAGVIPAHVAVLTTGSRYGSWLLLDTHEGTITDYIQFGRTKKKKLPEGDPDYWRVYETLPIVEFFENWKEKLRSLEWVALPHHIDDGMLLQQDSETDEIRDIYRANGWPDNFDREKCKQELLEWEGRGSQN